MNRTVDIGAGVERYVRTSDFPQYAYGLLQATFLASRLNRTHLAAIELGVAGGNGLVELERLAQLLTEPHGLALDVVGFDLGTGMPRPLDFRDMPCVWQEGFFQMDERALRSRLRDAKVILGDVAFTGPQYLAAHHAPIGFMSFDLDYYSSTTAAINAFLEAPTEHYLPRVICYFDDTVGPHEELHSEFTGELLAIREFNDRHLDRKLGRIHGLRSKLAPIEGTWIEGIFVLHLFEHPEYNRYVYPATDRQFPLLNPPSSRSR